MVSWEWFAIAIGGFIPIIAVVAVAVTQELSKAPSSASKHVSHTSNVGELVIVGAPPTIPKVHYH